MMRKHNGFVIDGSHNGRFDRPSPYFFAPDNVHPWSQSYQYMAELVINFVQQVRTCHASMVTLLRCLSSLRLC